MKVRNKAKAFIFVFFMLVSIISLFFAIIAVTIRPTFGKDLIIHSGNEVYYYPDVDEQDTIILPNNEIIDTDNLINLESNGEPYRTNEGLELYNAYDNQIFMEGHGENHDTEN